MNINFEPEAFDVEWEERANLLRETAEGQVAIALIALLLEVGIAKLNAEIAKRGEEPIEPEEYWDESMDGDFDSAMASAGMGTDEDYGYYGGYEDGGDIWSD